MNAIEREIELYQKRIKKIAETPDPNRLKCNELLYQISLDNRVRQLNAWHEGKPFAYASAGGPNLEMLIRVMGFHTIHLYRTADRVGKDAPRYFTACHSSGFPDSACDRVQVGVGMALSGDIPAPSLVVGISGGCEGVCMQALATARHFVCPYYMIDAHPLEDNEETLAYGVEQTKEVIKLAEKISGVKYDEDKLIELQSRMSQLNELKESLSGLARAVPTPVSGRDGLRVPPYDLVGDPRIVEYYTMYRDELKGRIDQGYYPVPNEKLRFLWTTSAPFYADPFAFLAKLGVSVPLYEASVFMPGHIPTYKEREVHFGRILSPLEKVACYFSALPWGGPPKRRVNKIVNAARDFKIDGIVNFNLGGCLATLGTSRLIVETADRELGIPSLTIEGWCLDESKYNKEDFEGKLEDFVDQCLERKGMAVGSG